MPTELHLFLVSDTRDVPHYSGTEMIPYTSEKWEKWKENKSGDNTLSARL